MAEGEIAYGAVIPLPPDAAFAFVSDPTTWPLFFDTPESAGLRVFTQVGSGTQLRGTTTIRPRPGVRGLIDRVTLRALARVYGKAMRRLPAAAGGAADPR